MNPFQTPREYFLSNVLLISGGGYRESCPGDLSAHKLSDIQLIALDHVGAGMDLMVNLKY